MAQLIRTYHLSMRKLQHLLRCRMLISAILVLTACGLAAAENWDPPAVIDFPSHDAIGNAISIEDTVKMGRRLFRARFNTADGVGRPLSTGDSKPTPRLVGDFSKFNRVAGPDAAACSSCHNSPAVGGSGDSSANVFVGAHFSDPPIFSTLPKSTNERNSTGLFGSGLVERLAAEMSDELQARRRDALLEAKAEGKDVDVLLSAKGVPFGSIVAYPDGYIDYKNLTGVDYDLVIKPFGIKGVIISLREFTVGALNQHHGIQAIERFGWERTGSRDFDGDGVENEFSIGQVTAMSLFQASLPAPQHLWSSDPNELAKQRVGDGLFSSMGCDSCHIKELRLQSNLFLEPNDHNRPGAMTSRDTTSVVRMPLETKVQSTLTVTAYTDLKRHDMCDDEVDHLCNEERKQDNVALQLFMTQKLWDLATSFPYCHRGDCMSLSEAILAHGGEGRKARDDFLAGSDEEKRALLSFLNTLGAGDISESSP